MGKKITAWLGIDPGKSGALCILTKKLNIRLYDWSKNDDIHEMVTLLKRVTRKYNIRLCVLEKIHPMGKVGVKTTWGMGYNFGQWHALLAMFDIPYIEVPPKEWQKEMKVKTKKKATPKERKQFSLDVCKKILTEKKLKKLYGPAGGYKDGRGDAVLIAYVAKQRG